MMKWIQRHNGFSLIEMIVVIVVLGILAAVAMQSMTATFVNARRAETEREMDILAEAIIGNPLLRESGTRFEFGYVGDIGAFPPDLRALFENPGGFSTWRGPYLPPGFAEDSVNRLLDEWGQPYTYDGGTTITSTGSGTPIVKQVARATSDYLINAFTGIIRDAADSLPGMIFKDSVVVSVTFPDGIGGYAKKTCVPDAAGVFRFDSMPVGTHPLEIVYTPADDTLLHYITILPRHKSDPPEKFFFAATYFSTGVGCLGSGSLMLLPSGAGPSTQLITSGCSFTWQCVDDSVSDEDNTHVRSSGTGYVTDLYAISDPIDTSCSVASVTVHISARMFVKDAFARVILRTHGANYPGAEIPLTGNYTDYQLTWTANPQTGLPWTWTEVNAIEAGVSLRATKDTHPARCTQVWIVVDYSD